MQDLYIISRFKNYKHFRRRINALAGARGLLFTITSCDLRWKRFQSSREIPPGKTPFSKLATIYSGITQFLEFLVTEPSKCFTGVKVFNKDRLAVRYAVKPNSPCIEYELFD